MATNYEINEMTTAFDIIEIIQKRRLAEYEKNEEFSDEEYGFLFKALAKRTQGSMLWNENSLDSILDCCESEHWMEKAIQLAQKQSAWLKEIGLVMEAKSWLSNLDEAREIAAA